MSKTPWDRREADRRDQLLGGGGTTVAAEADLPGPRRGGDHPVRTHPPGWPLRVGERMPCCCFPSGAALGRDESPRVRAMVRPRRPGIGAGRDVANSGGLFHPVQGHVHQQRTDHPADGRKAAGWRG